MAQEVSSYLARQAIFDRARDVVGYELLYRASAEATSAFITDSARASRSTILTAVCDIGLPNLIGHKGQAFVNMGEEVLTSEELSTLPSNQVVIEVLEDVPSTNRVREALISLRKDGFRIALDDFEVQGPSAGLADLADIIKVDVLNRPYEQISEVVTRLRAGSNAALLAEKIETTKDFEVLRELGFDLFQGYFLCRPEIVSSKRVPRHKGAVLKLLAKMEDPNLSLQALEGLVQQDAALSFKLLKFLNSSMVGLRREVTSIGQATVMIGMRQLKRWVTLIALAGFDDSPEELLTLGLVRARMCELLAERHGDTGDRHFTVGLFSVLDAMSGVRMETLMEELPLASDVQAALVERDGELGSLMDCVLAFERGSWDKLDAGDCRRSELGAAYLEAIHWADETRRSL